MSVYPVTVGEIAPQSLDELAVPNPLTLRRIICDRIESPNGGIPSVALVSGWDADAFFTIDAGSDDQRGIVRINPGTAPPGPGIWTLTYSTIFSAAPFPIVLREGTLQPMSASTVSVLTVTQSTPIAGSVTIVYHYMVI